MKENVRQQEEDLNAKNPAVFMEAQSASKQEVIKLTSGSKNFPLCVYDHYTFPTQLSSS